MSSIVTDQGILHYQAVGRGRPLILLHGWVNSWDVWRDSMLRLARDHQYRVYALDFWGFGDSAKPVDEPAQTFNVVLSTKVSDATFQYVGEGQVADAAIMGWLSRFFISALWPF